MFWEMSIWPQVTYPAVRSTRVGHGFCKRRAKIHANQWSSINPITMPVKEDVHSKKHRRMPYYTFHGPSLRIMTGTTWPKPSLSEPSKLGNPTSQGSIQGQGAVKYGVHCTLGQPVRMIRTAPSSGATAGHNTALQPAYRYYVRGRARLFPEPPTRLFSPVREALIHPILRLVQIPSSALVLCRPHTDGRPFALPSACPIIGHCTVSFSPT